MCRNIKPLFNFDPPATHAEIHDASLQFVRKLTGMNKPSEINEKAFNEAVEQISHLTEHLFGDLETKASPKDREKEAAKAKAKNAKRFANPG
jgi:hypothetical protein